jgi:MoxR-like ATPase
MSDSPILTPEELKPAADLTRTTLEQLDRILLGRKELHRLVLIGILSRGHVLFEGVPGLGKTALVRTIGQILRLGFKRVQFTPDLMPGDILGTHILQQTESGHREMVFQPGPVFTNILLADEINRASPKTQSALLETMQENSVTLLGNTRMLPQPFFVLASQNPIELEGTYPLPEAQLDRFLFRLLFDNVDAVVLEQIISERRRGNCLRQRGEWSGAISRACLRSWEGFTFRAPFRVISPDSLPPRIPVQRRPPRLSLDTFHTEHRPELRSPLLRHREPMP